MPALLSHALCTEAEARVWCRVAAAPTALGENEEETIENLINTVTVLFERKTGRQIKARALTERYDGNGKSYLLLNQYPVTSVTSVTSYQPDGTEDTDYDVSAVQVTATGRLLLLDQDPFLPGCNNVEVVYSPGWTAVPDDIKTAALQLITEWFRTWQLRREPIKSVTTPGGASTTFYEDVIPKKVQAVLDLYTLIGAAA